MSESRTVRVTTEAEAVALKYGSTVSKGISEMNWRLERVQAPTQTSATPPVPHIEGSPVNVSWSIPELKGGMPNEFWAEMRKIIREENDKIIEAGRRGF